jgi:hypothetical protein
MKIELPTFKIRASAASEIMTGNIGLTPTQEKTLKGLEQKEKLTDNQQKTLEELTFKRDNPELPKTVTSYLEQWMMEKIYNRTKEIRSKYLEKGLIMEDWSIDFIAKMLNLGFLVKNTEQFEDEYKTGEPDILPPGSDTIIDAKNSWDFSTFPLLKEEVDPKYYAQGQVYMDLTGRKNFTVAYVLSDTPEHLITSEAAYYLRKNGYGSLEDNPEIVQSFFDKMTYGDVADELRIRTFDFAYEKEYIDELHKRVELCRNWIDKRLKSL